MAPLSWWFSGTSAHICDLVAARGLSPSSSPPATCLDPGYKKRKGLLYLTFWSLPTEFLIRFICQICHMATSGLKGKHSTLPTTRGVSIKEAVWQLLWGLLTANCCIWQNSYFFLLVYYGFFLLLFLYLCIFSINNMSQRFFSKCIYVTLSNSAWYSIVYRHDEFWFC